MLTQQIVLSSRKDKIIKIYNKKVITTKYKNPPLAEAVFELFFSTAEWNSAIPGIFYGLIKDKYPKITQNQGGIGVVIGNQGMKIGGGNPDITQFRNEKEDTIIQLSSNMLTVNRVPEYTTWEDFLPQIVEALEVIKNVLKINTVERIGLKYLNKINAGETHSYNNFTRLFNLYPYSVKGFKYDINSINLNIEFPVTLNKEILSIQISTLNEEPKYKAPVLFQLYSIYLKRERFDISFIEKWLNENAHIQLNEAFQGFLTEETKKSFN